MNDRLVIRSIFRVDTGNNKDALSLIWSEVANPGVPLDLNKADEILEKMAGRQLTTQSIPVSFDGRALLAHIVYDSCNPQASQSVTFFAPIYQDKGQINESAPIALNKAQELDFAMLVNFGCCSKAALSLIAFFHVNGELFIVQKDAANVELEKRGFFERLWQDGMHTISGSHAAMHAIGQEHSCHHHKDAFVPR